MTNTAVAQAASWLATTPNHAKPHPVIPHLRRTYNLSAKEAVAAIQKANLIKARAH